MAEIHKLFPSMDGNDFQREELLSYFKTILTKIDELKDPNKLTLGEMPAYTEDYYNRMIHKAGIPKAGMEIEEVIQKLIKLVEGHRYVNRNYVANAAPLPNIASIIGNLVMVLVNGNNLWDVEGSAAAAAEVEVTSMLSKLIGYDENVSSGYTTWGGQGAVFNSLRLAIARYAPDSNETGVPENLYCFCSELSHYSLYKSLEATGIGVRNLVRVKVNDDHSMDVQDLKEKMEHVIAKGGVPLYVLATMGTTDTFGIDDIREMKRIAVELEDKYHLQSIYIHADSAMGGMYAFFNDYDFEGNPLGLEDNVQEVLKSYQQKFIHIQLADSLVFDFHKLGQTPYVTSLFLVKNREDLKYMDLDEVETPYVGNRGYGSYHTGYTLECSRMGSALAIYASLLAFGKEGYQELLANYIRVNLAFREGLTKEVANVAITNEISPITTFRLYPEKTKWHEELSGLLPVEEVMEINQFNEEFAEVIGAQRDQIYFGNTKKQRLVNVANATKRISVYAHKFFTISPYSTLEEVHRYVEFLKEHQDLYLKTKSIAYNLN
ncbi:aspartate aminotransferase family protein [Halalkalibacterium halodurans]|uniref:2,4-diaminobutyrate decarboxylase n=1 Tax=Halalkalibacterium halodurans (strain ATCC BAA-125 / DSM 18197 / FERM 7344 / JCM 9153 / C-125) TaxID=272558 RepID=Q9KFB9_HALH5|nr:aspartate aminotransferase family protein [Halalkalibacterium halodurans]MED4124573.1 aspartate aminotransferase family protein [Halalkalibacterium halodurans]MED4173169.1 aspartate aminotransferase family protein [Halalkalibacterium halodurans]BAB04285.1 2,4-diaminobutyrate decarboxylase [Halalkalibacterium halodurans C-125]